VVRPRKIVTLPLHHESFPFDVRVRVRTGSYFIEDSAREGNAVT
jgi:hypothetical protein